VSSPELSPEADQVVTEPPDIASWTENLLFSLYDGGNDIGMWLHLGTSPSDWTLWEDRVLIALPAEHGVLSMWAYHRTAPERRPAGANLAFRQREPFKRWEVSFDGFALLTPYETLRTSIVADGPKRRVTLELDVEMVTPPWDARTATLQATGKGSMESQDWAHEHYEQLCVARGTVTTPAGEVAFHGTGWRDHSRGPRGTGVGATWGGHVIMGAWFPVQQVGVGLSRYLAPNGDVTLEGGYIVEHGRLRHVAVAEVPGLDELRKDGEPLRFALDDAGTEVVVEATTTTSIWTMMSTGMPYGVDLSTPGYVYAINFASAELRGERAHLYVERSALFGS
jgi:hypothetical protein